MRIVDKEQTRILFFIFINCEYFTQTWSVQMRNTLLTPKSADREINELCPGQPQSCRTENICEYRLSRKHRECFLVSKPFSKNYECVLMAMVMMMMLDAETCYIAHAERRTNNSNYSIQNLRQKFYAIIYLSMNKSYVKYKLKNKLEKLRVNTKQNQSKQINRNHEFIVYQYCGRIE